MTTPIQSQPDGGGSQNEVRYVELEDHIANKTDYYAEVPDNQTEAGGVAWVDMFTQNGFKISLTERRKTGIRALDAIMQAIDYGIQMYKLSGRKLVEQFPAPAVAQPASPPAPLQMVVDAQPKVCQVLSVKHIKSKTSTRHMLVVKTAEYPDGAMAFENVLPKSFNINSLQLFTEYQPPADMAYCVIEAKAKGPNVTEFRAIP
jgi:hypothetical protein